MPDDATVAHALLHDANVLLSGDVLAGEDAEQLIPRVKENLLLAERLLAGNASDVDRASVADRIHGGVRTTFGV